MGEDGKEHFDKSKNTLLPTPVESCRPDYSIYPQFDFALSMTSRGCPRKCPFCHVYAKEGISHKVADVSDFWNGQQYIEVLDPNITSCRDKRDLMRQYRETKAIINFNQGLDIRLLDDADIDDINHMKIKNLHFAWDNPKDDLVSKFELYTKKAKHKPKGSYGTVYILTNFNSTMEENLERIYAVRDLHFDPYVMVYDKANAPQEILRLQRWCNAKQIFKLTPRFEDYKKQQQDTNQLNLF